MAVQLLDESIAVARKKQEARPPLTTPPARDRIDLRAEPDFVARLNRQAERLGLSLSAYLRLAATERLERDEASDPRAD